MERALAYVSAEPGATAADVSHHLFGISRARSGERTRTSQALKLLVDMGCVRVKMVKDKRTGNFAGNYYPTERSEIPRPGVEAVWMPKGMLSEVLRHIPEGNPVADHLQAEKRRLASISELVAHLHVTPESKS